MKIMTQPNEHFFSMKKLNKTLFGRIISTMNTKKETIFHYNFLVKSMYFLFLINERAHDFD